MKYKEIGGLYVIRLETGEKVIETLSGFCRENSITGGFFTGIGALSSVELGHFTLKTKKYSRKLIKKEVEIVSMSGNITREKLHCHIAVSTRDMRVCGGHLFEAVVSATCEIFLTKLETELFRTRDSRTGQELMDL